MIRSSEFVVYCSWHNDEISRRGTRSAGLIRWAMFEIESPLFIHPDGCSLASAYDRHAPWELFLLSSACFKNPFDYRCQLKRTVPFIPREPSPLFPKATFEMISFHFMGWASDEELIRHIEKLKASGAKLKTND